MPAQTDGEWGDLQDWPLIGLHAVVMDDGRVLTFGTDDTGMQGAQFIYDIYDPQTGEHVTLENTTPTDIFCSAAVQIPGTSKILIAGGDARPLGTVNAGVADVNIFDMETGELSPAPEGDMAFQRWYPSMISLPNGQMVMLGGKDINGRGITTPEIYTYGEGWKTLTGAVDPDLGQSITYPRAFLDDSGEIIYFATGPGVDSEIELMSLDPSGNGSLKQIGTLPFNVTWENPAVMYESGKILIQDAGTGLWSLDITGDNVDFTRVGDLDGERNWSNMTTLADGTVLINGGSSVGNAEIGANRTAVIWNPADNSLTEMADEDNPRLYHSASLLLNDGTLLSLGGGSAGMSENDYLDGQIYRPPYLYDQAGNLAVRPVIEEAPENTDPGDTIIIKLDDAADIQRLTFVKSGAATHAFNMEARSLELDFQDLGNNTLEVTIPGMEQGLSAGSWMLFAWDSQGVPSVAPMVKVNPIFEEADPQDPDNLLHNGSFETAADIATWETERYVSGWTSSNGMFELWQDGFEGVAATNGDSMVEIDPASGLISQSVQTGAGQTYDLTFDYEVRTGFAARTGLDILWNGEVIATVKPGHADPGSYSFKVIGTGGQDTLSFQASAGTHPTIGGLLDNVILKAGEPTPEDPVDPVDPVDPADPVNEVADNPGEIDWINGTPGRDAFIVNGQSTDYGWGPTNDGTGIAVWGANGFDLLFGFEELRFNDVSVPLVAAGGTYINQPGLTQHLTGTSEDDRFVIVGKAADYGWGPTADGEGIVVWGPDGFDILFGFETLEFADMHVPLVAENGQVQNIAGVTQFLQGSTDNDSFKIDGSSSDYSWGATEDGTGVVVWSGEDFDVLYDFEELAFNDTTVALEQTV